ncbi:MAG: sterol desaturase family protein [Alphaproteobacteria bacterium]|nr:sterol desaturase family protein [Alphaproteobacteria bacterium]
MSFHTLIDLVARAWPALLSYDTGRNVGVVFGVFLAVLLVLRLTSWRTRIQAHAPSAGDYAREIFYSAQTAAVFLLIGVGTFIGAEAGVFTLVAAAPGDHVLPLVGGSLALIIAHDAYFYWTHRFMHHRRLFKFFHRGHHRSRAPTPFAAYAFAWPEAIVQALFLPLMAFLMPVHATPLFVFLTFMIVRNVVGHAGVEFYPRWFGLGPLTAWITTTTHHDLHHEKPGANYGLYFRWWDQLMLTEHADYLARFKRATEGRSGGRRGARTANVHNEV